MWMHALTSAVVSPPSPLSPCDTWKRWQWIVVVVFVMGRCSGGGDVDGDGEGGGNADGDRWVVIMMITAITITHRVI